MSLSNELTALKNNFNSIKTQIINKGQTISGTDALCTYGDKISNIPNTDIHEQIVEKEIFDNTITNLEDTESTIIRTHGLQNLEYLETATFTKLLKICPFAFQNCFRLKTLKLNINKMVELPSICAFKCTPLEKLTGEILVPSNLVNTYKAHENWKYFSTIIKAL